MFFKTKKMKKIMALVLALGLSIPAVPGMQMPAVVEAAETVTLASVRAEAAASYSSDQKGFDLDLSDQAFSGGSGLNYSTDADGRRYMEVFNNLRTGTDDQTVIIRFKTTGSGLLFGAGVDTNADAGKNMTFAIESGQFRPVIRNTKYSSGTAERGLKGTFSSGLSDGEYHTAAMSFAPSEGQKNTNIRLVIDGGSELYESFGWGTSWGKGGFNQSPDDAYRVFQIGGGGYVTAGQTGNYASSAFDGTIDFITVINKAYSTAELQKITEGDKSTKDSFADMFTNGTCKTWLFTGGTETVADFRTSGTTRNYVGLFEDNLRAGGSYVERGRFVFNTAKRNADVASVLADYDSMIAPYGTSAVGIMVGASDYEKGAEGLDAFKEALQELVNKIYESQKLPFIITPYPSPDSDAGTKIAAYKEAIKEIAGKRTRVVDITSLAADMVQADGSLTPAGHQAVANAVKAELAITGRNTSFTFSLSGGSYTVAKKAEDGGEAQIKAVTAGIDSVQVQVDRESISGSTVSLEYTLTDQSGQRISASVPEGQTEFRIDGLKNGETYTLQVYDVSRDNVKESYQPVEITTGADFTEEGVNREYEDKNISVNETIQNLFKGEEPRTWLFMGDSITHGIVTRGYDNVPQMFAKYLDEVGRTEDIVLNTGVSNATLSTTLVQIEPRLERFNPDVVMIMLGTNDASSRGEMVNGDINNLQGFKDRYKQLVRKIHENNAESSIVLRVPCDMLDDGYHGQYETYFASIDEVAAEMREEIPGLNIAVVNHMEEWRNYRDNVRNDNIAKDANEPYGWLVDNVHPNGRGNLSMFQQIIKELGLYVNTSELANYAYEVNAWTDNSAVSAPVVQRGTSAQFDMSALSSYANGLKEVTLALTDEDGRKVSKTAAYDASESISLKALGSGKTYTASVVGKDRTNSKLIQFAATLTKEAVAITGIRISPRQTALTEGETTQLFVSLEPENADSQQIIFTSSNPEIADVDGNGLVTAKAGGTVSITATVAGTEIKDTVEIRVDKREEPVKPDVAKLTAEIESAKKLDLNGYTMDSAEAYRKALAEAENILANPNAAQEEITAALRKLEDAKAGLRLQNTGTPKPAVPAAGKISEQGGLRYKVTKSDAVNGTVKVVKLLAKKAKVTIPAKVTIDGCSFKVTAIARGAFQKNKSLKTVVIGNNVVNIGKRSFYKCSKLKKIIFKGMKAPKTGGQAFKGIKASCKVYAPKKMKVKQFNTLKKRMKRAGAGKKAVYKRK